MAMERIINTRLLKTLREEMSGVYSVSFTLDFETAFPKRFTARLTFGCEPERLPSLMEAAENELQRIMQTPINDEELQTEKEQGRREREQLEASNHYWMGSISGALKRNEDPLQILLAQDRNEELTVKQVQDASIDLFTKTKGELVLIQYPLSQKPNEK